MNAAAPGTPTDADLTEAAPVSRIPALGPRGEGWVALQGVCFALIIAAVYSAPQAPAEDDATAGTRMLFGYVFAIIAAVFLGTGIAELKRARAFAYVPLPPGQGRLVESGPYRFVRHPIYTGLILGALGLAINIPWAGTFIASALLALVLDLKRRREEIWLTQRYPEYAAYKTRTKALMPFVY
ncbi:MAG TPA: isoprenylcysteine carboxylmethyltransferase family protein [Candidatus Limnocylindrales bacterium]|nr:isoprenylcysteine carboxylmethyltransferase family protein [Candidatus Limnocylindrales bacterium]